MNFKIGLLAITLLFVSCNKQDDEAEKTPDERFIFGKEIASERSLSDGEFKVAKSMCQSLQNKREYFETRGDRELSFIFTIFDKSCSSPDFNSGSDYSVNLRVPVVGDLSYEGPRGTSFAEDILTDIHPSVESICTNVLRDNNVTNIQTRGAVKYQYRFLSISRGYLLEIGKFAQNSSGKYIPTFIETFSIYSSSLGSLEGMIASRTRATSCSNGLVQSSRQTLK